MPSTLKLLSIGVCLVLTVGYVLRRRPRAHVPLMIVAFLVDMAMVAYIELTRHAIETAIGPTAPIMKVHITFSVAVVVLYFVQIFSGWKRLRRGLGRWHGVSGRALLVLRYGNLVTSFMIS